MLISIFIIGYIAIIFEHPFKINKAAVSLVTAALCWTVYFKTSHQTFAHNIHFLADKFGDVGQILFFLLGAMALVELIDSHRGFHAAIQLIRTRSKIHLLWIVSLVTFILSSILDNLTTTILMVSILRKLVPKSKEKLAMLAMVVIAANAGGAWTPIGDVTTTMLWINEKISTLQVMSSLILPSLISMLVPLLIYSFQMKGSFVNPEAESFRQESSEPGARLVFVLGISGLVMVPLFKWLTGLPPYMGMLLALGVVWIVTDLMHHSYSERKHLRVDHILTKIDVTSILFFLGILMSVAALAAADYLSYAAKLLDSLTSSQALIATIIGLFSAVIDNVPLVAATMSMYDMATFPIDSRIWLLIAYAAGTGGSILIIGSAAGVALMGMEKIDFISYLKKATLPALIGFLAGMLCLAYF